MVKTLPQVAMLLLLLLVSGPVVVRGGELPSRPGIGPIDRRVRVDVGAPPWNSLVRVQTELGVRCTGFLVASRVVMTAAHCLYLRQVDRFIQPGDIHVLLGYDAGRFTGHARVLRFTVPPDYRPLDEAATAGLDRAVLVLDRSLPAADRLALLPVPSSEHAPVPVRLGGYGQDRDEVAISDLSCLVLERKTDQQGRPLLVHSCEATRGTSGAPLLWQRPDGGWAAIGIQIVADASAGGLAVPVLPPGTATGSGTTVGR